MYLRDYAGSGLYCVRWSPEGRFEVVESSPRSPTAADRKTIQPGACAGSQAHSIGIVAELGAFAEGAYWSVC